VSALLVPPLEQPKSPEFPLGVLTVTLAVPGAEITAVVIVTCNCVLLATRVLSAVPLMSTTEDETNWPPYTVRTKPACTSASVIEGAERDPMLGAGRALPHKGLSALQAWKTSKASRSAPRDDKKVLILFIWDSTTGGVNMDGHGTGRIEAPSDFSPWHGSRESCCDIADTLIDPAIVSFHQR